VYTYCKRQAGFKRYRKVYEIDMLPSQDGFSWKAEPGRGFISVYRLGRLRGRAIGWHCHVAPRDCHSRVAPMWEMPLQPSHDLNSCLSGV